MNDELRAEILKAITDMEARKDSITLGTPSKGGEVKVYIDAGKPAESIERIKAALRLRKCMEDMHVNGVPDELKATTEAK